MIKIEYLMMAARMIVLENNVLIKIKKEEEHLIKLRCVFQLNVEMV